MILQYRGYKNNWCYEEAERISHANVYVGDIIEEYSSKEYGDDLEKVKAIHNAVDEHLKKETGCCDEEIIYHVGNFSDMKNVSVVMLDDKNKHITRVFDKNTAYLLNNRGQTIKNCHNKKIYNKKLILCEFLREPSLALFCYMKLRKES